MSRTVAALVLVSVLSACSGGGSDDPAATPTSAAPSTGSTPEQPQRVYAVEELAAALPRTSQVPTGGEKIASCPGDDSCEGGTASVTIELERSGSAAERAQLEKVEFVNDIAQVQVTAGTDEAAATERLATARDSAGRYVGSFDIAAEKTSDTTFSAGERGVGTLDDLTIGGWTGFEAARRSRYSNPDGEGGQREYRSAQVHLRQGSSVLAVYVTVMSPPRDAEAATRLARQLATEYVQRLR